MYDWKKKQQEYCKEFKAAIGKEATDAAAAEGKGKWDHEKALLIRRHIEIAFMLAWSLDQNVAWEELSDELCFSLAALPHDTSLDHFIKGDIDHD